MRLYRPRRSITSRPSCSLSTLLKCTTPTLPRMPWLSRRRRLRRRPTSSSLHTHRTILPQRPTTPRNSNPCISLPFLRLSVCPPVTTVACTALGRSCSRSSSRSGPATEPALCVCLSAICSMHSLSLLPSSSTFTRALIHRFFWVHTSPHSPQQPQNTRNTQMKSLSPSICALLLVREAIPRSRLQARNRDRDCPQAITTCSLRPSHHFSSMAICGTGWSVRHIARSRACESTVNAPLRTRSADRF